MTQTHHRRALSVRTRSWLLCALAALALLGCGRGCGSEPVAVLAQVAGTVERDEVGAIEAWRTAAVDAGIALGEAVRTGPDGSAQLQLQGGGGLRMGANALVRFGGQPDETPTLELGGGEIEVEAGEALDIVTEFGPVRVERGGRVRAIRGDEGTQLEVLFGLAQLEDGARLTAGEHYAGPTAAPSVATAAAAPAGRPDTARHGPEGDSASDPDTAGDSTEADATGDDQDAASTDMDDAPGEGTLRGDGPRLPSVSPVEFSVAAGAGGVVHHPAPPALVGIRTGCADGEVRVASGGSTVVYTGGGTVGVRLARGRSRYEVYCGGQLGAGGQLTVTGDAGRQRLNTASQRHGVDADGRRYTFLYEGALPTLALRWPNAPSAEQYSVRLTGTRGRARLTSSSPSATVPRSALREGELTFQFEGGGRTSPVTRVTLRYDTATPTAYLASPPDRGFGAGASVSVAGTAQPGSRVSVGGQELTLDRRGSFSATATADAGGIAVRITTTRGVHYFVRRAAGG
ncbi:MAG: hypothetical protein R3B40_20885 [Polyangiales bacterium]